MTPPNYTFHVTLLARPQAVATGGATHLAGNECATLNVTREQLATTTFACRFEDAAERLQQLERMYCEPDGSFVWVSAQEGPCWQVDGNLYDRDERLLFVDLKGTCPAAEFDRLLACFGWPETDVMFQLVQEAVLLGEEEFRRYAERASDNANSQRS